MRFSPGDLEGALRCLDVPVFHVKDILTRLNSLRAEIGLPPVR